jgi:2,3-bisphosphoglycerate-dependent phosphoglycerate mutase
MALLILVRHAKSEWNELGLWTGWQDVPLAKEGEKQALETGKQLQDIPLHAAHSSSLKRARQTLDIILKTNDLTIVPVASDALKERNYGIFTGKNKWQVRDEVGEEEFAKMRRAWDYPIPEGESLKDVHKRVSEYFEEDILPSIRQCENNIVVAHGNSLRALIKHIEGILDADISGVEIGVGEAHLYTFDEKGSVVSKEIRAENTERGKI